MNLSKIKGYIKRLSFNKNYVEQDKEDEERENEILAQEEAKLLQTNNMINEYNAQTAVAKAEAEKVAAEAKEEAEIAQAEAEERAKIADAEAYTDDILADIREAYISEDFPYTEARQMVRKRDSAILTDILYKPEQIDKTDRKANQALTAVVGVPTAIYMAVVASSAVALPPVAMALVGFGIAGGVVGAVNTLTRKNSLLGSLYRKVKTRFGHANPKIKLKPEIAEFNAEKEVRNKILADAEKTYRNNKNIDLKFNDLIKKHYDSLMKTGESEFTGIDDDEESNIIFKELTDEVLDIRKDYLNHQAELKSLNDEKDDYNANIEANNAKVTQVASDTTNYKKEISNVVEESISNLNSFIAVSKNVEQIRKDETATIEECLKSIASVKTAAQQYLDNLDAIINNLSDDDAQKAQFIKQKEEINQSRDKQIAIYESKIERAKANATKNIDEQFAKVNDDVKEMYKTQTVQNAKRYVLDKAMNKLQSLNIEKSSEVVAEMADQEVYVTYNRSGNKFTLTEEELSTILDKVITGDDYAENIKEIGKNLDSYLDDIKNIVGANVELNNEALMLAIAAKEKEIANKEKEIADFKEDAKARTNAIKHRLDERRAIVTKESTDKLVDLKARTKSDFATWKEEKRKAFHKYIYTSANYDEPIEEEVDEAEDEISTEIQNVLPEETTENQVNITETSIEEEKKAEEEEKKVTTQTTLTQFDRII